MIDLPENACLILAHLIDAGHIHANSAIPEDQISALVECLPPETAVVIDFARERRLIRRVNTGNNYYVTSDGIDLVIKDRVSRTGLSSDAQTLLRYIVGRGVNQASHATFTALKAQLSSISDERCDRAIRELKVLDLIEESTFSCRYGSSTHYVARAKARELVERLKDTAAGSLSQQGALAGSKQRPGRNGVANDSDEIKKQIDELLALLIDRLPAGIDPAVRTDFTSAIADLQSEFHSPQPSAASLLQKSQRLLDFGDCGPGTLEAGVLVAQQMPVLLAAARRLILAASQ